MVMNHWTELHSKEEMMVCLSIYFLLQSLIIIIVAVPEGPFKRSKSALIQQVASPQLSLSAVRRDAQSTAELVAQLSENLPQQLAPDLSTPKSNSVSPNTSLVSRLDAFRF